MENIILRFENVSYSYEQNKKIIDDINIDFKKGKFYTIVGESGSGKTTFISLAAGLDSQTEGVILYKGKSTKEIGLEKFRNKDMSIVFQGYNLLNYMSALENITSAMSIKGIKTENNKETAIKMLYRVGLKKEQIYQKVLTLSGGQQQRVAIARALCCESDLIIADEPTGNLDEETSKEIINIFKEIVKEDKKTIIMVTHNKNIAIVSDEIYLMKDKNLTELDRNLI
ncbi:ABC transporter ATP-binding protein [Romboutsia sp.]|uniref:ABC transporter ATP-binding protein n=1 Tax=Romboutsia sp. TaxID=1965302 RepID=UPI002C66F4AE|nr:ABC transporter ATP-binding protein [Romboutsia sp.]HSQ88988.1 ABC transporter ATP-binding protein [Romboutsia sp.]